MGPTVPERLGRFQRNPFIRRPQQTCRDDPVVLKFDFSQTAVTRSAQAMSPNQLALRAFNGVAVAHPLLEWLGLLLRSARLQHRMMFPDHQTAVRVVGLDAGLAQGTRRASGRVPFKPIGHSTRGLLLQTAALGVRMSRGTSRLSSLHRDLEGLAGKTAVIVVGGAGCRTDQFATFGLSLH